MYQWVSGLSINCIYSCDQNFMLFCLMFVPCIIRRSRNNQHNALICMIPLFYILAPTCFGSLLPSSGSFLDPSELYTTHSICISSNSEGSKKLPDDGRLLPKHVGAVYRVKESYKSVNSVGHFY
jgi:hypothetical protein